MSRNSRAAARHASRAGLGLAVAVTAVGISAPAVHAQAPAPQSGAPMPQGALPANGVNSPATQGATALALPAKADMSASARGMGGIQPMNRPTLNYRVVAGDTLSRIAARHNTTVSAIARENNLSNPNVIRIGQMLRIPSAASGNSNSSSGSSSSGNSSSSTAGRYTVRAGDTLSAIAVRQGTTVSALVRANNLSDPNRLRIGQVLTLPGSNQSSGNSSSGNSNSGNSSSGSSSSGNSSSSNSSSGNSSSSSTRYTVRAGDTVSGIASRHNSTVQQIIQANNLSASAFIRVGQQLTIPASAGPATSSNSGNLVPNTFLGRTYPTEVVASANQNKATLLAMQAEGRIPSRAQMQAMVVEVARQMGVDPALAQAHAFQESGFNQTAVSPANAIGTMQVIPSSGEWASQLVGRQLNLLDPRDNVVAGVAIIRQLHRSAKSYDDAIAAYYQGLGGVNRHGWYPDTTRYVAAVKSHMANF
ncbi:LysM peptidoglycan-binding domain-containing protein [Bogoriella caseilytica]|uniref:LysM repeat protein n=1 Tax=Bogoriella caseilytica TaxID=56055 RepID=A0A3N2B952_9MICO|nr:LysM peptidoglycan-binding domain-containing protein [Bogoriella caseilytica]ROR71771.1 LysM repeat protein [Bogoriella caseilytica]